MTKLFDHFISRILVPYLEPRLRTGSIKAAKAYLEAVRLARSLVLRGFVIGSFSAILITGVLMLIFGVLALLPLQPQVLPIVAIVLGSLFAGTTGIGFFIFFREKNWLKVSKAYDVMDVVTTPWERELLPPNPFAEAQVSSKKVGADSKSAPQAAPLIRPSSEEEQATQPSNNQPAFS